MTQNFYIIIVTIYIIAGFPFGKIIGHINKIDIQKVGSKNIGATNVYRNLGLKWAILTAMLDVAKLAIPVKIVIEIGMSHWQIVAICLAGLMGHVFSPFLYFRGGKAISVYLGALIAINPILTLAWLIVWVLFLIKFRVMSAVNLLLIPWFIPLFIWQMSTPYIYLSILGTILIYWTHRSNIQRLWQGQEKKLTTHNKKHS